MTPLTAIENLCEYDRAGFGSHPRFTCLVCGRAVVRAPYMNEKQWAEAKEKFFSHHDSTCHSQQPKA